MEQEHKAAGDDRLFPLGQVQILNWLLLTAMAVAAWGLFSRRCAIGLLAGGVVANVSFVVLRRDLSRIFRGSLQVAKARYFFSYGIRFAVLAVILYGLIRHGGVHLFGLLVGLSTVVLSIVLVAAGEAKKLYFPMKEAA